MTFASPPVDTLHGTPRFTPFTAILFPSLHYNLLNFQLSHFPRFATLITFLTLFLKAFGLQGRFPKITAGNRFQSRMVLFTKEYFPISLHCLLFLIFRSRSTPLRFLGRCNLSPIAFHSRSPEYALKSAHMRDIILRCDNVSQFDSVIFYANLAAFFCMLSNACICASLYASQQANPYSRIGRTSVV
jgi:hypothetical protein